MGPDKYEEAIALMLNLRWDAECRRERERSSEPDGETDVALAHMAMEIASLDICIAALREKQQREKEAGRA